MSLISQLNITPCQKRSQLSIEQKIEICMYKLDNPRISQMDLKFHFSKKFNTTIARSTLSDICSGHLIETTELSNVKLSLLPPNTTSQLQPCDAGIMKSFKAHYRRQFIEDLYTSIEYYNEVKIVEVKTAIHMVRRGWTYVSIDTIINCWAKVNIINSTDTSRWSSTDTSACRIDHSMHESIDTWIIKLKSFRYYPSDNYMTANEYLEFENDVQTANEFILINFLFFIFY